MVQQDRMEEQSIQNKPIQSTLVPSVFTTLANTAEDFLWGVIPDTFLLAEENMDPTHKQICFFPYGHHMGKIS